MSPEGRLSPGIYMRNSTHGRRHWRSMRTPGETGSYRGRDWQSSSRRSLPVSTSFLRKGPNILHGRRATREAHRQRSKADCDEGVSQMGGTRRTHCGQAASLRDGYHHNVPTTKKPLHLVPLHLPSTKPTQRKDRKRASSISSD